MGPFVRRHAIKTLLSSAARSTAGNSNSANVEGYNKAIVYINITSLPDGGSLTINFEDSIDNQNFPVEHTETYTTTGSFRYTYTDIGKYIRVSYAPSGGSVTFSVEVMIST